MGRPLKIQKISTGSGNSGASVAVDLAYPNFGSLTNPVFNTPVQTLNNNQYLGVVGGAAPTDTPSATNPRIDVTVNIAAPDGSGIGVAQGYIIRQKGAHKYLVGDVTGVTGGAFVVGQAYQIVTVAPPTMKPQEQVPTLVWAPYSLPPQWVTATALPTQWVYVCWTMMSHPLLDSWPSHTHRLTAPQHHSASSPTSSCWTGPAAAPTKPTKSSTMCA